MVELATTIAKDAQKNAESATETAKNTMRAKQQFLSNISPDRLATLPQSSSLYFLL